MKEVGCMGILPDELSDRLIKESILCFHYYYYFNKFISTKLKSLFIVNKSSMNSCESLCLKSNETNDEKNRIL